ncbi:LysR family transcriptional regulator [Lactobacillus xylocopicola]|uniref:Transcriptional regulator n=1 Tax=Lactobacillus xylocopicola TaxID=2976676 RepID=A0ABM8BGS6_9LACO|nr:LysR family transcriptional regulator [Lactobacillus xylocopicola]BDR60487.1 transcriptional regulator [Lactobacillus xylocopicola]
MPKTDTILSTKSLQYFLQLIDTMNYTQAAQILGITQPALTQQIKKLERAIGTPLFGQMGKQLYLTEAGKELQTGAIKLISTINNVVSDIQEFTQADKGNITIGVLEGVDAELVRQFLIKFNQATPDIITGINYFNRKDLWYNLDNNLIDLAIFYVPQTMKKSQSNLQNQYDWMKICSDRLTILTHDSKLEAGKSYLPAQLKNRQWVAYPDHFYLTKMMKAKFGSKINVKNGLKAPMRFSSTKQLVATAEETSYDTFVSGVYYQHHQEEISLTPIYLKDEQEYTISVIYRKGKNDVPRIKKFLTEFKDFLAKQADK